MTKSKHEAFFSVLGTYSNGIQCKKHEHAILAPASFFWDLRTSAARGGQHQLVLNLTLNFEVSVPSGGLLAHFHRLLVHRRCADVPVGEVSRHESADVQSRVPFVEEEPLHLTFWADFLKNAFVLHFLRNNTFKKISVSRFYTKNRSSCSCQMFCRLY